VRVFLYIIIVFILIGAFTSLLQAEELPQAIFSAVSTPQKITPLADGIYGNISLDLRDIDIKDALKYFALKSGLNIVSTEAVKGRVTLIVENVLVKDVFDIMLRSNELAYDKTGNIYNVMTEKEYTAMYGKQFSDIRQVKVFRLKYAIPDQAFSLLDTMKSKVGRVLVDTESGSVLCMDSAAVIEQMEAALKEFEKSDLVRVFDLNYAKAKVVEEQLESRLDGKKVGSIKADVRANQVIVQALPHRMREIEDLIKALDEKTQEVFIESKVIKIKIGDDLQTGIEWEGLFEASNKGGDLAYIGSYPFSVVGKSTDDWQTRKQFLENTTGGNVGAYPFSGTTSNFSASTPTMGFDKMHIGVVGSNDFDVLFKYLKTENEAKILSNPKVVATNGQEARIHVGERQAYVTTTTTTGQTTSTVSEQVNFIDIGIQMTVTPTINEDGYIEMKLKTEVSSVVDVLITPTKNSIPIVDTSLAETTVLVKEGATVVIGGMRRIEKTKVVRRVPFFSRIPLLGKFFEAKMDGKSTTELLVLITPTIITGDALVVEDIQEMGVPNMKSAREYDELERRKQELETHIQPKEEAEGMNIKSFRLRTHSDGAD